MTNSTKTKKQNKNATSAAIYLLYFLNINGHNFRFRVQSNNSYVTSQQILWGKWYKIEANSTEPMKKVSWKGSLYMNEFLSKRLLHGYSNRSSELPWPYSNRYSRAVKTVMFKTKKKCVQVSILFVFTSLFTPSFQKRALNLVICGQKEYFW